MFSGHWWTEDGHIPVEEEQDWQHRLVNIAVADPLVEEEAGVPHHRVQGVLPHDVVQLVRVQVLVHQLVAELAEVVDAGAGGAPRKAFRGTQALGRAGGHGITTAVGQVQAAVATVQADGWEAAIVWHLGGQVAEEERRLGAGGRDGWVRRNGQVNDRPGVGVFFLAEGQTGPVFAQDGWMPV